MGEIIHTVIVGSGQAGLSLSYYLGKRGIEHQVFEKAGQAADAWRNHRWDSFTLVTPNFAFRIPGAEYQGDEPDGFMPLNEIVSRFEQYIERYTLPVRYNTQVTSVEADEAGRMYTVRANGVKIKARNVVIATGLFQGDKIPSYAAEIPTGIRQIHSGEYRNPQAIPSGAVLVVGSAQSGCQIAQELYRNGHKTYLCVGTSGRAPRRYRGKDIFEWLDLIGFLDQTPDRLPSPQARFAGNPHLSGKDGGQTLNLHQFYRDGIILLGHLQGIQDGRLILAPDLKESLGKVDRFEGEATKMIETYIERNRLMPPEEKLPVLNDGYQAPEILSLDLKAAGINTIIWATGYTFDFHMVKLPVLDKFGFPITQRGMTQFTGLYFLGMPWLYKRRSGILWGVGEDAAYLADQISG
jgi:putative flavoprotein involved in K+ transport